MADLTKEQLQRWKEGMLASGRYVERDVHILFDMAERAIVAQSQSVAYFQRIHDELGTRYEQVDAGFSGDKDIFPLYAHPALAQWIKTSERHPEKGVPVLCYFSKLNKHTGASIGVAQFRGHDWGAPGYWTEEGRRDPSHWRPLPAAPTEEQK